MEVELCKDSSDGEEDYESPSEEDVGSIPICIRHPGWTNVILVIAYCMLGIIFLTQREGWQPETAFYVVVQIVTTIGYGDITVTTEEEVFMIFYVLLGTVLVAKIIDDFSGILLESASNRVDEALHQAEHVLATPGQKHHICPARCHRLLSATLILGNLLVTWTVFFGIYESCTCSYGYTAVDGCEEERCSATAGTTKTFLDAMYMAVITFSTVGFGDFTPDTKLGRMVGSVLMVLGVGAWFNMVAAVVEVISSYQRFYKNKLRLSRAGFRHIDRDGSGHINKTEFQVYMLLRQNRVTPAQLRHLDRLFACMDRDRTGKLSYEEITAGLMDVDLE